MRKWYSSLKKRTEVGEANLILSFSIFPSASVKGFPRLFVSLSAKNKQVILENLTGRRKGSAFDRNFSLLYDLHTLFQ